MARTMRRVVEWSSGIKRLSAPISFMPMPMRNRVRRRAGRERGSSGCESTSPTRSAHGRATPVRREVRERAGGRRPPWRAAIAIARWRAA
eukprot:scaffold308380_cov30-Tisochrysis_lutea.AAC.1